MRRSRQQRGFRVALYAYLALASGGCVVDGTLGKESDAGVVLGQGGTGEHEASGGSSGATATCPSAADDTECLGCQKSSCCQPLADCHALTNCLCISSCLDTGATEEACETHCGGTDDGEAALLHVCSQNHCAEACLP